MLMHTGAQFQTSTNGLITTSAAQPGSTPEYALEGSVFIGGAVVQWLRDGLQAIKAAARCRQLAESVPDSGGVMFVPAFTGLGAPYWNADARGAIVGPDPRQHGGPHRARGAGEHRLPERGAAAGDGRDAVAAAARR
jgi:glycerol kinase